MSSLREIRQSSLRQSSRSANRSISSSVSRSSQPPQHSHVREPSMSIDMGNTTIGGGGGGGGDLDRDGVIELTKNNKYCVSKLPANPSVLKSKEPIFQGSADQNTNYAFVLSAATTYVWNYTSPDHVPNTLSFPSRGDSSDPAGTMSTLVAPAPGSKEPGIVTIDTQNGQLVYWEAVGGAVADGLLHRRKEINHVVGLYSSEVIENFQNVEPAGLIATTSSGRFILITLRDATGKPYINSSTMRGGGTGLISSIKGAISLAGSRRGIVSVKPGKITGKCERQALLINNNGDLSIWECSRTSQVKLLFDEKLQEILLNHISELYDNAPNSFQVHDVELFEEEGSVFILASFIHDPTIDEVYYIVYTIQLDNRDIIVKSAHRVQTFTSDSSRPPRMYFPKPYETLFVVFSHGIVLLEASPEKTTTNLLARRWEDVITFRDDVEIVASSIEDLSMVNGKTTRNCGLIVLTHNAGVIRVERFPEEKRPITEKVQELEPELAKTRIEQAVFYGYGQDSANPLSFAARREMKFDSKILEQSFLEVSQEILATTSPYMPPILPSLTDHLSLRISCLERLAQFLHLNFPDQLSVSARLKLLWDLEKTVVAKALWVHIDSKLHSENNVNVLVNVIYQQTNDKSDPLRHWFLQKAPSIENLLVASNRYCQTHYKSKDVDLLIDTNTVLLDAVYNSALEIRSKFAETVFGLKDTDSSNTVPWTSSNELIRAFESQYELTRKDLGGTNKSNKNYQVLSNQLVCLVESLCYMYSQLLKWINNTSTTKKLDGAEIANIYTERRGGWLRQVVETGHKESALRIAEQFGIYRSLVEVLVDDWKLATSSGNSEKGEEYLRRLEGYFGKFGYDFASVLYQYLGETSQLKALLTLFPSYHGTYLEKFFSTKRYANISWAHDVELGNYVEAGKTLSDAATRSTEEFNTNKKLKLSLAKLSVLAGKEKRQKLGVVDSSDVLLTKIGTQIELVAVQESLAYQTTGLSTDDISGWLKERGTSSLLKVLQRAYDRLQQQRTLSVEELIDVLTLSNVDNKDSQLNFYRALRLCHISNFTPQRKAFNEMLIWRRLLISDDWSSVINTKKKSDAKVQQTTERTLLYQTLDYSMTQGEDGMINVDLALNPENLVEPSSHNLEERFPYASKDLLQGISFDIEKEKAILKELIETAELTSWTKGIYTRVHTVKGKGSLNKKLADRAPLLQSELMDVDTNDQDDQTDQMDTT